MNRHHLAPFQAAAGHLVLGGYLIATHSNGISALATATPARSGSYKSGWLICAKLRHSMVAPNRNPLASPVTGGVGRSHQGKIIVVGAVGDGGPSRIRLAEVPDYSADSLHPFIAGYLTPGATTKTEGRSAYPVLPALLTIRIHRQDRRRPAWVHRIFSNLKVWALDVYHGLRRPHLQSYLDGFVFRFNRRQTRYTAFLSLLSIAVADAQHDFLNHRGAAARERVDASQHLRKSKGLHEVVIAAGAKAAHAIIDFPEGAEDQRWSEDPAFPEPADDIDAVNAREHAIHGHRDIIGRATLA